MIVQAIILGGLLTASVGSPVNVETGDGAPGSQKEMRPLVRTKKSSDYYCKDVDDDFSALVEELVKMLRARKNTPCYHLIETQLPTEDATCSSSDGKKAIISIPDEQKVTIVTPKHDAENNISNSPKKESDLQTADKSPTETAPSTGTINTSVTNAPAPSTVDNGSNAKIRTTSSAFPTEIQTPENPIVTTRTKKRSEVGIKKRVPEVPSTSLLPVTDNHGKVVSTEVTTPQDINPKPTVSPDSEVATKDVTASPADRQEYQPFPIVTTETSNSPDDDLKCNCLLPSPGPSAFPTDWAYILKNIKPTICNIFEFHLADCSPSNCYPAGGREPW